MEVAENVTQLRRVHTLLSKYLDKVTEAYLDHTMNVYLDKAAISSIVVEMNWPRILKIRSWLNVFRVRGEAILILQGQ